MSSRHTPKSARSWRDIPQQVTHRSLSSEGRKRVWMRVVKTTCCVGVVAALAWGGLEVAGTFQENPKQVPSAMQSAPLKDLVLSTDGVLNQAWTNRTLALPKNTSLMALDLFQLRARLLASGQVRAATLTRNFPSTLTVSLSERSPVARISTQDKDDRPRTLLVARDGVVYEGEGYDANMVATLPWLAGVKLTRVGGVLQPIVGMESVAELLAKAKLEAEHLYSTWKIVSLGRLESDGEIEVTTRESTKITFGITEDFFRQLAALDAILDAAAAHPEKSPRAINLAVGAQVPVAFNDVAAVEPNSPVHPAPQLTRLVLPTFTTH